MALVLLDPLRCVFQLFAAKPAFSSPSDLLGGHEICLLEYPDMFLEAGERHAVGLCQLADRCGTAPEALEDVPARRIGQSREGAVECRRILNYLVQYIKRELLGQVEVLGGHARVSARPELHLRVSSGKQDAEPWLRVCVVSEC